MRRLALLLALALATTSCMNEIDQSTRPENIVGTYTLVTYGGKLPAPYSTGSAGVSQVIAGELVMSSDRTWTETLTISTPIGGSAQTFLLMSEGSWSIIREQAYVIFNDKTNGYQFSGIAAGGQVTTNTESGKEIIFRR